MSLRDEIAAARQGPSYPCAAGVWLAEQPDREEWEAALADPTLQVTAFWRVMKAHGFGYEYSSIRRHKAGGCTCART